MYTTCIFCHLPLGANEAVEHFPVGRKLAFDAAKGRLWVVCARCAGWNLTPLEERWEAIEDCERLYRDTRRRISTDNIGLAKLPEGLELVRIGPALRPELAAWRYGARFAKRWQRMVGASVASATGLFAGAVLISLPASALGIVAAPLVLASPLVVSILAARTEVRERRQARQFLHDVLARRRGETTIYDPASQYAEVILQPGVGEQGWGLRIHSLAGYHVDIDGADALRTAAIVLPAINLGGGGRRLVRRAVGELDAAGEAAAYFRHALDWGRKSGHRYTPLAQYPREVRLALEMAAHEETERRAMEGELAILEQAWKDAEEIAAIADNLVVPADVRAWPGRRT